MGLDAPSSASLCSLFPNSWGFGNAAGSTIIGSSFLRKFSLTCMMLFLVLVHTLGTRA